MGILLNTHRAYIERAATESEKLSAQLIADQTFPMFWQRGRCAELRVLVLSSLVTNRALVEADRSLAEATRMPGWAREPERDPVRA